MAAGASAVLLYGSVARGTQHADSDIDLIAVFDDLDYATRWPRKVELTRLAGRAAGRPVEVRVTDWPEWVHRSKKLRTSFERGIAAESIALCTTPNGEVNWDKEIGMPTSDTGDAGQSLKNANDALRRLATAMKSDEAERDALADRDADAYLWTVTVRLRAVCSESQIVLETALKALVHLHGAEPPGRVHKLDELLGGLADHPVRPAAGGLMVGLDLADVTLWRQRGTYAADFPDIALADLTVHAYRLATAACGVARLAADHLRHADPTNEPMVTNAGRVAARIEADLERWDFTRSTPTAQMGIPEPPEPAAPVQRGTGPAAGI